MCEVVLKTLLFFLNHCFPQKPIVFPKKNIVFQHVHFYTIVLKRKIISE